MNVRTAHAARFLGRGSILVLALAGLQACPGGGGPSGLYNVNEKIAFPLTGAAMGAPNGSADDAGWDDAYTVRLEDGSPVAAGSVKTVADANNIYLYAQVEDSDLADGGDALVLGLNPTNAADGYRKLIIYPCAGVGGTACGTGAALTPTVDYQTGSTAGGSLTWSATNSAIPAGFDIKATSAGGAPSIWSVEIRIDKAALGIPADGFFGMFVDAIATDDGGFGSEAFANNFSWPTGTSLTGAIETADMQTPRWGNATLDANKFDAGLQIVGFSSNGVDPSRISLTQANSFYATVANYPVGTGSEPTANNVAATFKINNIGLMPSWSWSNIPTSGNPTAGVPIPAKEAKVLSAAPWTLLTTGDYLGSGKTEQQFFTDNLHQCVRVEVTSTGNPMVQRQYNMNFVTVNSPFESSAQIAAGMWRERFKQARAVYLTERFFGAGADIGWQSRIAGAEPVGEHAWAIKSLDANVARLGLSVLPSERLTLPLDDYQLDAGALAQGKAVDVRVKPGSVLTLLADGEATMGGKRTTPWGAGPMVAKGDGRTSENGLVDALRPGTAIGDGALIGSFDDFRTSFAIGSGTTLYVPADARMLRVKVAGQPQRMQGRWVLEAVSSAPTPAMLDGLNPRRLRESRTPVLLPLGINLPFHVVRGTLDTGQTIDIRRKRFQVGIPMGSFGHFIYRVRRGPLYEAARPDPRSPILDDIRLRPDRVLRPTPRPTIG